MYIPDSYTRQLDKAVERSEMVYGYDNTPPPYGHENYQQNEIEKLYGKKMDSKRNKTSRRS